MVKVPGTTANIGPGFDCLGAALSVYNRFRFSLAESGKLEIKVKGAEADRVKADESNLAYQAFVKFYENIGQNAPDVVIEINLGVPLARGLGSSATAIVGGLLAGNALAGGPLSQAEVMELAIALEGHPDNVVPALLGGCRLSASVEPHTNKEKSSWQICDIPWHHDIIPVIAIPDFELSTAEARKVLPQEYSRADAIFNGAHLGMLLRGLATGNGDWLRVGMSDRIHQPYRKTLIPGYDAVQTAALDAGAWGMVISGAGPTLLALVPAKQAPDVTIAMATAWQKQGITARTATVTLDPQGAVVSE